MNAAIFTAILNGRPQPEYAEYQHVGFYLEMHYLNDHF